MKNFLITTLILILVPTVIFVPVYALLIYSNATSVKDYAADAQGRWNAFQYYYEGKLSACDEDTWLSLQFDGQKIVVDGTILTPVEAETSWEGRATLHYEADGQTVTFLLSFDDSDNLKVVVSGTSYIIFLRKSEG